MLYLEQVVTFNVPCDQTLYDYVDTMEELIVPAQERMGFVIPCATMEDAINFRSAITYFGFETAEQLQAFWEMTKTDEAWLEYERRLDEMSTVSIIRLIEHHRGMPVDGWKEAAEIGKTTPWIQFCIGDLWSVPGNGLEDFYHEFDNGSPLGVPAVMTAEGICGDRRGQVHDVWCYPVSTYKAFPTKEERSTDTYIQGIRAHLPHEHCYFRIALPYSAVR